MANPGATVRWDWGEMVPLTDQWRCEVSPQTEARFPDRRDRMLAYWIENSQTDQWTFDQLGVLLDSMIGTETIPPALGLWAYEVAARRRKRPTRPGPKGDRTRDCRIAGIVHFLSGAMSGRAAKRLIGKALHMSEEAVESARARGRRV